MKVPYIVMQSLLFLALLIVIVVFHHFTQNVNATVIMIVVSVAGITIGTILGNDINLKHIDFLMSTKNSLESELADLKNKLYLSEDRNLSLNVAKESLTDTYIELCEEIKDVNHPAFTVIHPQDSITALHYDHHIRLRIGKSPDKKEIRYYVSVCDHKGKYIWMSRGWKTTEEALQNIKTLSVNLRKYPINDEDNLISGNMVIDGKVKNEGA